MNDEIRNGTEKKVCDGGEVVLLITGNFVVSATFQDLSFTMLFFLSPFSAVLFHFTRYWDENDFLFVSVQVFVINTTLISIKVRESLMRFVRFTLFSSFEMLE